MIRSLGQCTYCKCNRSIAGLALNTTEEQALSSSAFPSWPACCTSRPGPRSCSSEPYAGCAPPSSGKLPHGSEILYCADGPTETHAPHSQKLNSCRGTRSPSHLTRTSSNSFRAEPPFFHCWWISSLTSSLPDLGLGVQILLSMASNAATFFSASVLSCRIVARPLTL